MYAASPNNSTTSLSGSDDDDVKDIQSSAYAYYPRDVVPAQWSTSPRGQRPQSPSQSPASLLPPEILIHVLRHLHSPRDLHSSLLVCRAWCECAVELLWHRPSFTDLSHFVQMLQIICSENQIFDYPRFVRRLNFIYLSRELTDSLFIRLSRCTKLERLTLINCVELTDEVMARVLSNCKNLVALDLTNIASCTDNTIQILAQSATKLQALNLGGCKNITDDGVIALAEHCPMLRRVKLSNVKNITNKAVSALAKNCPVLLEIDLHGCVKVTDEAIRDLWLYLPHLRDFRLAQCSDLTDLAFPATPQNDHETHINGIQPFVTSAPNPSDILPPLRLFRLSEHLRMLDLTSCSRITDDAVAGIIASAPKIRNLYLAKCSELTDVAVESICKLGKHLHYLHLGHAAAITDRSVRALARSCTRLRYIDLACCPLLTDLSVLELSSLPKLRRIGLVRVANLTDQAIFALADRHQTLERIHLSYCENISVLAIHFLLERLTKLTHLSLTGIPAFRRPELQQFCRSPPREFNLNQRAAFCVYSGRGVDNLRAYLANLMQHVHAQAEIGDPDTDYDAEAEEEFPSFGDQDHVVGYSLDLEQTPRLPYITDHNILAANGDQIIAREEFFEDDIGGALPVSSPITTVRGRAGRMIVDRGGTPESRPPVVEDTNPSSVATTPSPTVHPSPSRTLSDPGTPEAHRRFGQNPIIEAPSPSPQLTPYASRHYVFPRMNRTHSHASDEASSHSAHSSRSNGVHAAGSNGAGFYRSYGVNGQSSLEGASTARTGSYTPDLVYAEIGHGRGSSEAGPGPASLQQANNRFRRASLSGYQDAIYDSSSEELPELNGTVVNGTRDRPSPLVTAGIRYRATPSQSSEMTARPDQHDLASPIPYLSSSPMTRQLQESVHSALTGSGSVSAAVASDLPAPGIIQEDQIAETARGRSVRRSIKSLTNAAEHYANTLFGRAGSSSTSSRDNLLRDRAGSGSGASGSSTTNGRNAH